MTFNALRSAALLTAAISAPSAAQVAVCGGPVTSMYLDTDSTVLAKFGGDGMVRVCMLTGSFTVYTGPNNTLPLTVSPTMCQSLYASFLTARGTGKRVHMWIRRADCNFGDWIVPNPYPYAWEFPG